MAFTVADFEKPALKLENYMSQRSSSQNTPTSTASYSSMTRPAPTRVSRVVVEGLIKQLEKLGESSHPAYCDLATSMQSLLDRDSSTAPVVREIAVAFQEAKKAIDKDSAALKRLLEPELSGDLEDLWDIFEGIENQLPFKLIQDMDIECPSTYRADWVSELSQDLLEKYPALLRKFILIQEQRATMEGQVILRRRLISSGSANRNEVDEALEKCLREVLDDMEITINAIRKATGFDNTLETINKQFEPYVKQAETEPPLDDAEHEN